MLSTGLVKVDEPPLTLVSLPTRVPLRRSLRTTSTVNVSLTFNFDVSWALTPPDWISGIGTLWPPMVKAVPFSALVKRN